MSGQRSSPVDAGNAIVEAIAGAIATGLESLSIDGASETRGRIRERSDNRNDGDRDSSLSESSEYDDPMTSSSSSDSDSGSNTRPAADGFSPELLEFIGMWGTLEGRLARIRAHNRAVSAAAAAIGEEEELRRQGADGEEGVAFMEPAGDGDGEGDDGDDDDDDDGLIAGADLSAFLERQFLALMRGEDFVVVERSIEEDWQEVKEEGKEIQEGWQEIESGEEDGGE
ncbi:hypothetical protein GGS23DRAFT_449824 [Durotheca rogersii]|uniref:uncharacterized protein n=1 Tax=Durotheca rogersii TaxID=419775 RepID=UPI00222061B6|nr:uncharacterized protein GGS23DRAFT_449824 [Durotheca rogersii]KAI5864508.1 hypothetical protein GGS23DRAFT_449824 [Durotheca rogersii]